SSIRHPGCPDDDSRHPDARLVSMTVHISISSVDVGGYVAEHDIALSRRINEIVPAHGATRGDQ
nr:hypothetical protein [Micromonospora sp. DSM 115978]